MNLYKQLEADTGRGCGVFNRIAYLAQTEEREHQLRLQEAAKFYGLGFYEVSREEARELHPLAQSMMCVASCLNLMVAMWILRRDARLCGCAPAWC